MLSASLANILNAEGEKIQLAIKQNADICQLLDINASVACTIEDIMWLEFISYHKLKATLCTCGCDCNERNKSCEKKPQNCCETEHMPCDKPRCPSSVITKISHEKDKNIANSQFITICGKVFDRWGKPCKHGVVTASGGNVRSAEICFDGSYAIANIEYSNKIVVNASCCGKCDSFLLQNPKFNCYSLDFTV